MTLKSKTGCLWAAEKPGQVLVFLLPTQEGRGCKQQVWELDLVLQELAEQKGAAGQSSTTASMGVGESSRLGLRFQPWLGGGGHSWMTVFPDFPSCNFPGCLHQSQDGGPGRLSRQKHCVQGKSIWGAVLTLWGCHKKVLP